MRTEPAKLLFVGHCALPAAEIRHDFFDGLAGELLGVEFRCRTNQLIAFAQRKSKTDSDPALVILQLRDGVGINRVAMDCIAAVTVADGITRVAGGNGL